MNVSQQHAEAIYDYASRGIKNNMGETDLGFIMNYIIVNISINF